MAPKKAGGGAPAKVKEDKTFGMKNKKGSKAQQQIKVIQQQQQMAGKTREQLAKDKKKEDEKRLKAELEKTRLEDPFYNIVQPRVPFGVDPKTITCAFWAAGKCEKGSKCKFAHSKDAGRKTEKKDLYTDMRDGPEEGSAEDEKKNDTMDKWDQAKLDSVILSKHGNPKSTTDKVCKYFLQAVEDQKYGWRWQCPNNGDDCMYRHALPPGFVLKAHKKEMEAAEKANEISLEDFLESARHSLGKDLTPVTPETFAEWRKRRLDKKAAEEEAVEQKKRSQAQANKMLGLSGREMFTLNSELLMDDDDDVGAGDEFDMTQYFKNWEQARDDNRQNGGGSGGDGDDDDESVRQTNDMLKDVQV